MIEEFKQYHKQIEFKLITEKDELKRIEIINEFLNVKQFMINYLTSELEYNKLCLKNKKLEYNKLEYYKLCLKNKKINI